MILSKQIKNKNEAIKILNFLEFSSTPCKRMLDIHNVYKIKLDQKISIGFFLNLFSLLITMCNIQNTYFFSNMVAPRCEVMSSR